MNKAVILDAVRTPFAKQNGAFRDIPANILLAQVLSSLTESAGIEKNKIDDVITGTVTQIGEQAADIARQSALIADFPVEIPGMTLNRFCGSGQQAVHSAAQMIEAGDAHYVIASGVESMTRVPMLSDLTIGEPFKNFEAMGASLLKKYPLVHQGISAEMMAQKWGVSRKEADEFAVSSHAKAQRAVDNGFIQEIMPVKGVNEENQPFILEHDQGIRAHIDPTKLAGLQTIFRPEGEGVVTAGNASQISDGAAALLIADHERVLADGFKPRARFRARVVIGSDPIMQLHGPIEATKVALKRAGLTLNDIDWLEINEAFASVPLAWIKELDADPTKVNPWGGAIAHGHPLGATGSGLMAKVVTGLEKTDGQFGLLTMCIGLGMATATIIERI